MEPTTKWKTMPQENWMYQLGWNIGVFIATVTPIWFSYRLSHGFFNGVSRINHRRVFKNVRSME